MMTFASLFSGGGGADIGAMQAGLTPIWGVECDERIADAYALNIGAHVYRARVQDVDSTLVERPDWLHASPPCPNFSVAKMGAQETAEDVSMAQSVCDFLTVLKPPVFSLENVRGYAESESFGRILATLCGLGYSVRYRVLNAADYGVPQTRVRLVLWAVRDGEAPELMPTHSQYGDMFNPTWIGWYEAIEDLIPTLEESKFAHWQERRLPAEMKTFLVPITGENSTYLNAQEPAPSITTAHTAGKYRTFLVDGKPSNYAGKLSISQADSPTPTLTATQNKHPFRAWLETGRVVKMSPMALARFQSFPDTYVLPEKKGLAARIIGNAAPPRLMREIVTQVLGGLR